MNHSANTEKIEQEVPKRMSMVGNEIGAKSDGI
jgi:hypothetical protein